MNTVVTLIEQYLSEVSVGGEIRPLDPGAEDHIVCVPFFPDFGVTYVTAAVFRVVTIRQQTVLFAKILTVGFNQNLVGLSSAVSIIVIPRFFYIARIVEADVIPFRESGSGITSVTVYRICWPERNACVFQMKQISSGIMPPSSGKSAIRSRGVW